MEQGKACPVMYLDPLLKNEVYSELPLQLTYRRSFRGPSCPIQSLSFKQGQGSHKNDSCNYIQFIQCDEID